MLFLAGLMCFFYIVSFTQISQAKTITTDSNNRLSSTSADEEYPEIEGEEVVLKINMDNANQRKVTAASMNDFEENNSRASIPNYVFVTITPQSSSYKITITNLGVDKIDSVKLVCKIYKNSGAFITSKTKTFTNVKPGNKSWTWNIAKGATVQETIKVSGTARDGKDVISFRGSTVRYNFVGGKYGSIAPYDGQRHHMPSDSVSPLSTYSGPAIRMITSDHKNTASYGSSLSAKNFRAKEKAKIKAGEFLGAQKLGISNLQSRFGAKYNAAINSMVAYTKGLGYTK